MIASESLAQQEMSRDELESSISVAFLSSLHQGRVVERPVNLTHNFYFSILTKRFERDPSVSVAFFEFSSPGLGCLKPNQANPGLFGYIN